MKTYDARDTIRNATFLAAGLLALFIAYHGVRRLKPRGSPPAARRAPIRMVDSGAFEPILARPERVGSDSPLVSPPSGPQAQPPSDVPLPILVNDEAPPPATTRPKPRNRKKSRR